MSFLAALMSVAHARDSLLVDSHATVLKSMGRQRPRAFFSTDTTDILPVSTSEKHPKKCGGRAARA